MHLLLALKHLTPDTLKNSLMPQRHLLGEVKNLPRTLKHLPRAPKYILQAPKDLSCFIPTPLWMTLASPHRKQESACRPKHLPGEQEHQPLASKYLHEDPKNILLACKHLPKVKKHLSGTAKHHPGERKHLPGRPRIFLDVLVSPGIELIFLLVDGRVLCFGLGEEEG